jgi:long-chain acyl-CoA synthetase
MGKVVEALSMIRSFLDSVRNFAGNTAVIDDQGPITFADLGRTAGAVAQRILSTPGVGETVGIALPPGAGFVAAFHGVLLAGKAVVPINFLLGSREIDHVLKDSGVRLVISSLPLVERLLSALPGTETIRQRAASGELELLDITSVRPDANPPDIAEPPDDTLAVLMYTSGTSGLPKGVRLTHGNLRSDVTAAIDSAGFQQGHRFLGVVPLFHAFGMTAMMLVPIRLGSTVVYLSRFSPMGCLSAIREHRISLMFGVPSMYQAIARLKGVKREDFAGIYAFFSGGEPLPAAVAEQYRSQFGVELFEGYGLTETSPIITLSIHGAARAGSVGKPVATARVRIAGDDGVTAVPAGSEGEVQIAGPMVFAGYHHLPDVTAAAFTPDGYLRTGDVGHLDPDGFLFITGRLKDLIIVGGEKLHPREIEEVLALHPAVADVAVIGRKDESRGEAPVAFVVAREGQSPPEINDLRTFCRERHLITWKHPREVVIVPALPRSPTGKVLKRELARQLPPPS